MGDGGLGQQSHALGVSGGSGSSASATPVSCPRIQLSPCRVLSPGPLPLSPREGWLATARSSLFCSSNSRNFLQPPPTPPSGRSSVWGSSKGRGRGTGAHPFLLCCLSLPLPLPSLLRVTFHPSLGCPSKAAPGVNNFGWQPHTKPWPETIVLGTMAKQPNNEVATVLSDIPGCPGKGGGAAGPRALASWS